MTNQHPIVPSQEQVDRWFDDAVRLNSTPEYPFKNKYYMAAQAAQWGADQELEACCEWLRHDLDAYELVGLRAVYLDHNLRAARRPKLPSLKEQALDELVAAERLYPADWSTIRRALDALDD